MKQNDVHFFLSADEATQGHFTAWLFGRLWRMIPPHAFYTKQAIINWIHNTMFFSISNIFNELFHQLSQCPKNRIRGKIHCETFPDKINIDSNRSLLCTYHADWCSLFPKIVFYRTFTEEGIGRSLTRKDYRSTSLLDEHGGMVLWRGCNSQEINAWVAINFIV